MLNMMQGGRYEFAVAYRTAPHKIMYHSFHIKTPMVQVLVSNKGLIDAPFKLCCPDTTFGSCFSISPEEGVLAPGASQVLQVSFSSRTLGAFCEDLMLRVEGQPQPPSLTFR